jgi:hypothetical protein
MQLPKIHLSSSEMELMQNEAVILTKNRVLDKTRMLLETVQQQQENFLEVHHLSNIDFNKGAKISRGENYLGLPYLILDHPRQSAPDDLFFIRQMFWWGNFFSSTLHLSGSTLSHARIKIISSYELFTQHYIGINEDPWVHHFGKDNYRMVNDMSRNEFEFYCKNLHHLKIAKRWMLSSWHEAPQYLFEHWKFLLECLR